MFLSIAKMIVVDEKVYYINFMYNHEH